MTDRLYFTDGTHSDYLVVIEREVCLTCVTPHGDVDYKGYDEVERKIPSPDDRYGTEDVSEATDSPSQATEADATDDTSQPSTIPHNGRAELQQAMLDVGIDLDDVSVLHVPSDEVYRIELADGIDDYDAIDAWTDDRFGKDKPGYIDWTEYEKDDGSTGYYPDAYCVPYDALEDVVGA